MRIAGTHRPHPEPVEGRTMVIQHSPASSLPRSLPSVDRVLREPALAAVIATHGRSTVTKAVRETLTALRRDLAARRTAEVSLSAIAAAVVGKLPHESASPRPVL